MYYVITLPRWDFCWRGSAPCTGFRWAASRHRHPRASRVVQMQSLGSVQIQWIRFRIQVFYWIRIRIQAFTEFGFGDSVIIQTKIFYYNIFKKPLEKFFGSKTVMYRLLKPLQRRPGSSNIKFRQLSFFGDNFGLPGFGFPIQIRIPNPAPDPLTQLSPDKKHWLNVWTECTGCGR